MVSWDSLQELFARSHTWRLLEPFCERYSVPVEKKMDFSLLAKVQDEFEHLSEVFEQDLRIGESDELVEYCKDDYASILRSAVWKILEKECLASKALLISDEDKERAAGWS